MKKFVGFYYRCSFNICLCACLSLIGFLFLSSSAFALQSGDFTYTVSNSTVTITKYTGTGGDVVIPSTIDGMPVVIIGNGAFYQCYSLTNVTIPGSVTSIGQQAFLHCSGLTSVTIGNSVTSIGQAAFMGCSSLTSVTIGKGVASIGNYAFNLDKNLTSIVVDASNTVYSSQDGVLYNKTRTTLIQYPLGKSGGFTIPDSVISIGMYAFAYCNSLTTMTIPDSVIGIGPSAFEGCISLTSVTIGKGVASIGNHAFALCGNLTEAYFLGNAPTMGSQVFVECSSSFIICYTAGSTGFTTPTWYGYFASVCGATLIELASFTTTPKAGKVIIQWSTESEIDNSGFNLYRSETEDGEYTKINDSLIPAQASATQGASYEFIDKDVQNRKAYYYKLEDIDLNGQSTMHGPVSATPRWFWGILKK